ncbi:MAG: ABC transporter ATP-binding protein, partial [Oligoflexia bacterium]|nr:ABC transporter ATP-binding protein [Oligoflexia bacterium]
MGTKREMCREKKDEKMDYISIIKKFFLKEYWFLITVNALFFLLLEVFSIANPYLFGKFIDSVVISASYQQVINYVILMIMAFIVQIVITYFNNYFTVKLKYTIEYSFAQFLADKIKYASKLNFENNNGVYLQERIRSDVRVIVDLFFDSVIQAFVKAVSLVMIVSLVVQINIQLLFIFLLTIPIYVLIYFFFKEKLFVISNRVREQVNIFTSVFCRQLEQIKFIKTHSLYDETREQSEEEFNKKLNLLQKQVNINL